MRGAVPAAGPFARHFAHSISAPSLRWPRSTARPVTPHPFSFLTLPSLTSHSIFDPLRGCDVTGRERKAGARHSRVPFVPRVRSLLSGPCLATVSPPHSSGAGTGTRPPHRLNRSLTTFTPAFAGSAAALGVC